MQITRDQTCMKVFYKYFQRRELLSMGNTFLDFCLENSLS